ncbi:MAG: membrane protein insertase YidC [Thermomicrobiales bacterium]|nr:membrane protein insertase YidC [Thermomicrobiales bacterium]
MARTLHSAGLAVIVFTIIIKTLMLPLTIKATRSSRSMQELQPKVKELQKKYKNDRQMLSQETMKLYSQYGVNPMAGCLPMLVQMPIFFGLYRSILHLSNNNAGFPISDYWSGGFLWLESLAKPDPFFILPIAAGIFQFVQTRMMRPANQGAIADPQQKMMNQIMNFMPITVVLFGWTFASGPVLYWVTQSVYSVVQQWLITGWGAMHDWFPWLPDLPEHRRLGYKPPRDEAELEAIAASGAASQGRVMGWFQTKMDEAQKQQAQRQAAAKGEPETASSEKTSSKEKPAPSKSSGQRPQAKKSKKGSAAASVEVDADDGAEGSNGSTQRSSGGAPTPRKSRSTRNA